mmetsp:Transcript_33730/g.93174  ORF Transcript_33730/g.93174 Transcript_33730/m.93174 type:complete len:386 (-) Transcript_33730:1242-2399(-)
MALFEDRRDLINQEGRAPHQTDEHNRPCVMKPVAEADLVAWARRNGHRSYLFLGHSGHHIRCLGGALALLSGWPPCSPFGLLVPQTILHCLVHRGEKPMLADELSQKRLPHGFLDAVPHHNEGNLDATTAEVTHEVVDQTHSSGVDVNHRSHLQDNILGRVHVVEVYYVTEERFLDERYVGEVHRRAEPANEHVGDEDAAAFLLHRAVDRRARNAPQDRDLRSHRLQNDNRERERNGHADAHQHPQEERAPERHDPKHEIVPLHSPKLRRFCVGNERQHRVDHNGREHELRQEVDQRGKQEQRGEHGHAGNNTRKLGARTHGIAHGGARDTACHGVAGKRCAHEVGHAQREKLLTRLDVVAMFRRQVLSDGEGLHVADDARGECS